MAKERTSRSDRGVMAFARDFFKEALGLSDDMATNIMNRIKERGELADMKRHVRNLPGDVYKRFNLVLDMAEEKAEKEAPKDEGKPEEAPKEKPEEKKEMKESFMNYLLNEIGTEATDDTGAVTMDVAPEDIRDPEKRKEAMLRQRKMKMGKGQEATMIQKKIKELQARLKAIRSGGDAGGL